MKPILYAMAVVICLTSCSKNKTAGNDNTNPVPPVDPEVPVVPAVDPPVSASIAFFLSDWTPRNFTAPESVETALPSGAANATVTIDASTIITKVPRSVFGQNANSWMSQIVTENSLLNHLKNLQPSIIRFPGGSISDVYFWIASSPDKPASAPDAQLTAEGNAVAGQYWYGRNNDSWTISLDNYYNLLQQTGSQGMITVNYGFARYGTSADPVATAAHLAADWVRYDNGRTKFWEIGNESNGTWEAGYRIEPSQNKDGQPSIITGELYGRHVQVFIDSMKKAAASIGKTIYISANILEKTPAAWQTATDKGWNAGVLRAAENKVDYYTIHSYFTDYKTNASAATILNTATTGTTDMAAFVKSEFSTHGATVKPIALTEWNITSEGSMQQVSFINGMHAAILLAESIRNKYGQTSRWDLANGWSAGNDHGLFDQGDEPGGVKWNPRPAFYYMFYMGQLTGDRLLATTATSDLLAYGSSFSSGETGAMIVNKSTTARVTSVIIKNVTRAKKIWWYTLTGGTDNGEFSRKVYVNGTGPDLQSGGPLNYKSLKARSSNVNGEFRIEVPARSVVYMVIE